MQIYENFDLSKILYYKIGGKARFVLKVQSKDDVLEALEFIKKQNIQSILPVGLGANILMSDEGFDGAVLWFAKPEKSSIKKISETEIEVFASHHLDDVIQYSFQNYFRGLEWAGGLPSTIGGAIRGNVGAFGHEIAEVVQNVDIIDLSNNNSLKRYTKEELEFDYRESIVKHNQHLLVVSVVFSLLPTDDKGLEEARKIYKGTIEHRKTHNPIEFPSCGSTFKNIREKEEVEKIMQVWPDIEELVTSRWHGKVSMGYAIKRLGLSGEKLGGAQISPKHSNYIVNIDSAKFQEVYALIGKIKETFSKTFGFAPEPEVHIIE